LSINIAVDLRTNFGDARNQGARPTCMAFAASDTHSFVHGTTEFLSAESAHYSARRRSPPLNPNAGVSMGTMIDAIRDDGQPKEEIWPYLTVVPSSASWAPPADCGQMFRHSFVEKPADIASVIAALDAGRPAIIGARITLQFYLPPADYIIRTAANDPVVSNHALVAVGHGTNGGDALVLVRNSWGDTWANLGYAWLTSDYLGPRILRIAVPST
jgi:hypothetical protein